MKKTLRLAVLISGGGTNMEAIARNCAGGAINAEVVVVVSNVPGAAGLARAEDLGIPTRVVDHRDFADREAHERAVIEAIDPHQPDLVVLAGYMRLVTPLLLARMRDEQTGLPGVVNIHPADTRAYQGTHGYEFAMGLTGGKRLTETKITVHFVDSGMDTGPVIRQRAVPVLPGDDLDALRTRGLAVEYELYSEVIGLLADGRVRMADGSVIVDD